MDARSSWVIFQGAPSTTSSTQRMDSTWIPRHRFGATKKRARNLSATTLTIPTLDPNQPPKPQTQVISPKPQPADPAALSHPAHRTLLEASGRGAAMARSSSVSTGAAPRCWRTTSSEKRPTSLGPLGRSAMGPSAMALGKSHPRVKLVAV